MKRIPLEKRKRGRPSGAEGKRNRALRELSDKLVAEGASPLEVMLTNMRFYHEQAESLLVRILTGIADRRASKVKVLQMLKDLGHFRDKAQACASDAARFVHPQLSAVAVKARVDHNVSLVAADMTPAEAAEAYASTLTGNLPRLIVDNTVRDRVEDG